MLDDKGDQLKVTKQSIKSRRCCFMRRTKQLLRFRGRD